MVFLSLIFILNSTIILLSRFHHKYKMKEYYFNILYTLEIPIYYLLKNCQES